MCARSSRVSFPCFVVLPPPPHFFYWQVCWQVTHEGIDTRNWKQKTCSSLYIDAVDKSYVFCPPELQCVVLRDYFHTPLVSRVDRREKRGVCFTGVLYTVVKYETLQFTSWFSKPFCSISNAEEPIEWTFFYPRAQLTPRQMTDAKMYEKEWNF